MARKQTPQWLQGFSSFQKPKSEQEHPPTPIDSPPDHSTVLLEDDPSSEPPPDPRPPKRTAAKLGKRVANTASSATRSTAQHLGSFARAWRWQLIWLGILGVFGGTGAIAFLWLSKVPPAVDCQKITPQSIESEQLFCAQQAAQSGNAEQIISSINLVKDWTTDHPLYGQSRSLLQDWSNALLILARDRVTQRDIKGAVSLANQVPKSSPVYKDAQAAIDRWQAEYRRGEAIYAKITDALKKQQWDRASEQMAQLALVEDPGWQARLGEVREQSNNERKAWKLLTDARNFAKSNPPAQFGQAIAITDPIDRKTFVWTLQANQEVLKWRNTIFQLAIAQYDQQNVAAAGRLLDSIPQSVQLTSANQDLVRLVRAREIETADRYNAPGLERIAPLMMATHLVRQIDPQSPFASRAKTLIPRLEQQTQDLMQLNVASTIANLQQIPMLQIAIAQAAVISPKRPGRVHAQTLLAQWRKELQSMQDRPVLARAQQVAKSGKIGNLRSAVALASLVKPQRSLRIEAQTNIANWTNQIEIIEDRPIINNARAIASTGQLGRAIEVAGSIRPGRALYGEAQGLIGGWVYQIQLAEDRSVLNQAASLASQGYLSRAIDVAAGIAPGRPLYGEARGAIGQWAAERAEILRQRDAAPQPAPSEDSPAQFAPEPEPTPPLSPEATPP
ncbi:hypothetical protein [Leptolyngbya sp. NIES-2104]|uniref:hypothetical protein n=1 Tax=Leptolyngbya sp. NIES-2104 TaxID=1552121 RepID=UPI0006EC71D2|nr:hypothetical protein [Leptolyngbya sp. NIES-2104]GAP97008.1 chromosome segregation ATPase [Leptolyngbya sp. NIES-2104]